jgi:membrane-associated phospholipid phosphatase
MAAPAVAPSSFLARTAWGASKLLSDERSLQLILAVQRHRTPLLDLFFTATSFLANADFYLLAMPTLIWQGAPRVGRQTTLMVTMSLIVGNTLKDLARFPRPPSPPAWRPGGAAALDSTSFADFGWPSTHAMNAVSNPLFVAWSLRRYWDGTRRGRVVVVAAGLAYTACIACGRLYLGAHGASDIRWGLGMGLAVGSFWLHSADRFDELMLCEGGALVDSGRGGGAAAVTAATAVGPAMLGGLVAVAAAGVAAMPAPMRASVSTLQSAELLGLFVGCAAGSRQDRRRRRRCRPGQRTRAATEGGRWVALWPLQRTVLGFGLVLVLRVLSKVGASAVLGVAVRRGWLSALARALLTKLLSYGLVAWSITATVPQMFACLGIEAPARA